jgi:ATP phosphoribosyltransferase regulatory subunit
MSDRPHLALLPEGFYDVLPPDAAREAAVIERLMAVLASHAYDRVKPPLLEYEDSLLAGVGSGLAPHSFRLMDPMGNRMLGIRADMTVQVARIARDRLGAAPRPLRLAYAGQVLRIRGTQLRPERQFAQVGAELIGSAQPAADAEVALLAVDALAAVGIGGLSLDLNAPTLVPTVLAGSGIDGERAARLRHALDRKDAADVATEAGTTGPLLAALLAVAGQADAAMAASRALALPVEARQLLDRLGEVIRLIRAAAPGLAVTVDLVEHRGFEYHTGVAFTLFARGAGGEIGRGGRYRIAGPVPEEATGCTLFMDTVLDAASPQPPSRRVLMAANTAREAAALRRDGYVTVAALDAGLDARVEARRLGCGWYWQNDALHETG